MKNICKQLFLIKRIWVNQLISFPPDIIKEQNKIQSREFIPNSQLILFETEAVTGGVLFKKSALKNFAIFIGKLLCWSHFLINFQTFWPATLINKKRLQHRRSPVSIPKFLKTPILKNNRERLLLSENSIETSIFFRELISNNLILSENSFQTTLNTIGEFIPNST